MPVGDVVTTVKFDIMTNAMAIHNGVAVGNVNDPKGCRTKLAVEVPDAHGITSCLVAHDIPFVAQASVSHHMDFMRKVARGLEVDGPAFINIVQPCHRGWRCKPEDSIKLARVAVETRFWPLYQVDHGQWKVKYKPKEMFPILEWFKAQGRFKHLAKNDKEDILAWHQEQVETNWADLLEKEEASKAKAENQEASVRKHKRKRDGSRLGCSVRGVFLLWNRICRVGWHRGHG